MNNHWPIIAALSIIIAASVFGMYRHSELSEAAKPQAVSRPVVIRKAAVAPKPAPASAETAKQAEAAAPITTAAAERVVTPVKPNPVQPEGTLNQNRAEIMTTLRETLRKKLNIEPTDTANGGFEIVTEGAHLDVAPMPDWSIAIFSFNREPNVESEGFKLCFEAVVTALNIDMTQQYYDQPDGKKSMRAWSKAGRVTLVKDPKKNGSVTIRPLQRRPTLTHIPNVNGPVPTIPGAPPPNIVKPAVPGAVQQLAPVQPVAPPKPPPANDDKF